MLYPPLCTTYLYINRSRHFEKPRKTTISASYLDLDLFLLGNRGKEEEEEEGDEDEEFDLDEELPV